MTIKLKHLVAFVAPVGLCAAVWLLHDDSDDVSVDCGRSLVARKIIRRNESDVKKARNTRHSDRLETADQKLVSYSSGTMRCVEFNEKEERELTEAARKLLAELSRALDAKDFRKVMRLVRKVKSSPQEVIGLATLPIAVKRRIIEAMGYCGAEAIPDIVESLADEELEIVKSAMDEFKKMMRDFTMGDRERALVVTAATKVLTDQHDLQFMMMELNTMRHSVCVETVLNINDHGTAEARDMLQHYVDFYTGEKGLNTEEALLDWLDRNPDGPRDEAFYGGWGK